MFFARGLKSKPPGPQERFVGVVWVSLGSRLNKVLPWFPDVLPWCYLRMRSLQLESYSRQKLEKGCYTHACAYIQGLMRAFLYIHTLPVLATQVGL